jgi:YD repeat-containing protein
LNRAGTTQPIHNIRGNHIIHTTDASLNGKIEHTLDGKGKPTIYHYNESGETRGFLTSVEDAEGHRTKYHYDEKGHRDQVSTPLPNNGVSTTSYEFDNLDRITKITNPDSTTVETEYSCCHKEWIKDENGKTTRYKYDKRNRLWAVINSAVDTTLAQGITATATQIQLTSIVGLPTSGTVLLESSNGDSEIVTYSAIN